MIKKKPPLTDPPGCQYLDCIYRQRLDGSCSYYTVEGVTRTYLHRDEPGVDINNPCREYNPGQRQRPEPFTLKPNRR